MLQEAFLGTLDSKFGVLRDVYVVRLSDGAYCSCRVLGQGLLGQCARIFVNCQVVNRFAAFGFLRGTTLLASNTTYNKISIKCTTTVVHHVAILRTLPSLSVLDFANRSVQYPHMSSLPLPLKYPSGVSLQ